MGYTYKKFKDKLTLLSYEGDEEIVKIPNEIDGYIVNKVASMCFFDLENVKEIHFPEGISIENNAIVCCCNLEKIYISTASKLGNFIEDCDKAQIITNNSSISRKIKRNDMGDNFIDLSIFNTLEKSDGTLHLYSITGLKKMKSVIIPDNIDGKKITSLDNYLFENCYLDSVVFNDYIKIIPKGCFKYANINNLENIQNIEVVETQGFYCSTLKKPIHLENLKKIYENSFGFLVGEFTFGNKLEFLEARAFKNTNIVSISLKDFKGDLPVGLFEDCSNLKMVILPKNTTILPEYFFYGCVNLEEIEGLKNIIEFKAGCLSLCRNLVSTINFKKVKIIGYSAFAGSNLQRTIRIGNCQIDAYAFSSIQGCEHVIFDDIYTKDSIPVSCFIDSKIQKVTLNKSIKKLERYCFARSSLKSINVENIEELDEAVFKNCPIKKLELNSIKRMFYGSFESMRELISVDLSKSTISLIPSCAFQNCIRLKTVLLPDGLKEIERLAFAYTNIQELKLPNSLEKIGSSFLCGTKIKEIIIPENVKRIQSKTFAGLFKNTVVKIISKNIQFDSEAFSKTSLKELDLSHINMTKIPVCMFENSFIGTLKLPNGITNIGTNAFFYAQIEHIEMDTSKIEYIDRGAFYCAKIKNFGIIPNAKHYGERCYGYSELKNEDIIFTNVELIDVEAFFHTSLKSVTINSLPDIKRGNFEYGNISKISVKGKVYNRLKTRVYFKYTKKTVLEKI